MANNQTLEEWWDEDAERVNKLAEYARKKKYTIGKKTVPPKLNADGTIVSKLKELVVLLTRKGNS